MKRFVGLLKGLGLLFLALMILLACISIMPTISEKLDKFAAISWPKKPLQAPKAENHVDGEVKANEAISGKAHIENATIVSDGVVTVSDGQAGLYVRSEDNYILTILLNGEDIPDRPKALSTYPSLDRGKVVTIEHFHKGWYNHQAKLLPDGAKNSKVSED